MKYNYMFTNIIGILTAVGEGHEYEKIGDW